MGRPSHENHETHENRDKSSSAKELRLVSITSPIATSVSTYSNRDYRIRIPAQGRDNLIVALTNKPHREARHISAYQFTQFSDQAVVYQSTHQWQFLTIELPVKVNV